MKTLKLILAGLALMVLTIVYTQAQVAKPRAAISNAVVIAASVQSNIVNAIPFNNTTYGRGFSVMALFASTNASTATVGFAFAPTVDGTNYATTGWLWATAALNGTTGVRAFTPFTGAQTDNTIRWKLVQITNGHNASLFVTNVVVTLVQDR